MSNNRYTIVFLLLLIFQLHHETKRYSAEAFAAKKKGGGKKTTTASTNRGFGKAPPTYEEVISSFTSRLTEDAYGKPCPCGLYDGKTYLECCAPYHQGKIQPTTPTAVLQSRYSAFYFRNIDYVIQTVHPNNRDYSDDKVAWAKNLNKQGMFDSFDFVNLKVPGEEEIINDNEAYITFEVKLKAKQDAGSNLEGKVTIVREKSKFLRNETTGIWSYARGDVRSTTEGVDDIVLNS